LREDHDVRWWLCLATEDEAASDAMGTPIDRMKAVASEHRIAFEHVPIREGAGFEDPAFARAARALRWMSGRSETGSGILVTARGRRGRSVLAIARHLVEQGYVFDRVIQILHEADPDALSSAAKADVRSGWLDVQTERRPLVVAVREALRADGMNFGIKTPRSFASVYTMTNGSVHVNVSVAEYVGRVVVLARLPFTAPAGKRSEAIELANRLNWSLPWGTFEVGIGDGVIRARVAHEFGDELPSADTISRMRKHALGIANQRIPAFGAIVHGDATAEDAVKAKG
jgi:hypothetical protein